MPLRSPLADSATLCTCAVWATVKVQQWELESNSITKQFSNFNDLDNLYEFTCKHVIECVHLLACVHAKYLHFETSQVQHCMVKGWLNAGGLSVGSGRQTAANTNWLKHHKMIAAAIVAVGHMLATKAGNNNMTQICKHTHTRVHTQTRNRTALGVHLSWLAAKLNVLQMTLDF